MAAHAVVQSTIYRNMWLAGELHSTLWVPSFIFYELAALVRILAGNRMDPT